jgi:hypothetical protein
MLDLTIYHKKLLQSDMISVSKLCCPVCWELLNLLGGDNRLSLRGHHLTVYPVELPEWLPHDIVTQMMGQFQKYLRDEVTTMLMKDEQKAANRRSHHASHKSESAVSVVSTIFNPEVEDYYNR